MKQVIPIIKETADPTAANNVAAGNPLGQHWFNEISGDEFIHSSDGVWSSLIAGPIVDGNFITLSESGGTDVPTKWHNISPNIPTDRFNMAILPAGFKDNYGKFNYNFSITSETLSAGWTCSFLCISADRTQVGSVSRGFDSANSYVNMGKFDIGNMYTPSSLSYLTSGYSIRLIKDYDPIEYGVLEDGTIIPDIYIDSQYNHYSGTKIGTKIWLRENLRTTELSDGTPLRLEQTLPAYQGTWYSSDAIKQERLYCSFNFDKNYSDLYGYLYNFRGAAGKPTDTATIINPGYGFRFPLTTDWSELRDYLVSEYGYTTSNYLNCLRSLYQEGSTYTKVTKLSLKSLNTIMANNFLAMSLMPKQNNELVTKYYVDNVRQNIFTKQFVIEPYNIIWDKDFIKVIIADASDSEGKEFQRRSIVLSSVAVETGSGRVFINHKLRKTTIENNNYNPGINQWVVNTVQPAMPFVGFYIKDLGNTLTPENDIGRIYISILQSEDEPEVTGSRDVTLAPYVDIDGETSYWNRSNIIVDDKTTDAAHSGWIKTTFEWFYQTLNTDVFPGTVYKTVDDTTLTTAPYLNNELGGVLKRAYYPTYCRSKNADMILEALTGMDNPDLYSNPDILNLYCHYSNSVSLMDRTFGVNILWIGAGDLEDADASWVTSYGDGMEFIEPTERDDIGSAGGVNWNDVHQQSPAVAIVGAKMKYIKNQTGAGWNTIRLACRETATQSTYNIANNIKWDKYRGYGVINVAAAIIYINDLKTSFKAGLTERYHEGNGYCSFMNVEDFTSETPLPKRLVAQAPKGNYVDNAAALTAGLVPGDYYHTDGVLKIVIEAT